MRGFLERAGYTGVSHRGTRPERAAQVDAICRKAERIENFGQLYELLENETSRQLLVDLLAYRVLGARHVKLPSNSDTYWKHVAALDAYREQSGTYAVDILGQVDLYNMRTAGLDLRLHAHALNVLETLLLEQYRYPLAALEVGVAPGDICIDAGGCWGDTALYFASKSAPSGRVYSFEFVPENRAILEANLDLNPRLKPAIRVVPRAVGEKSGERIGIVRRGPGSRAVVGGEAATFQTETLTIDDLVKQERLSRVDFVKMDIEGAELSALRGAAATLRAFRPKLAIALYHRIEDLVEIPAYFHSLGLGYKFYLGHVTIVSPETVLFAQPSTIE